jgi:hypothetical protein
MVGVVASETVMKTIDILLQGEGLGEVQVISLPHDAGLILVLEEARRLGAPHGPDEEVFIFIQDEDKPLRHKDKLPRPVEGQPLSLHVHRRREIEVEVHYNGQSKSIALAPSRTIGWTKDHVAKKLFGMDRHDAAEHVLQLTGTHDRPDPDTHIGALAHHHRVAVDLVPLVRVEGEE